MTRDELKIKLLGFAASMFDADEHNDNDYTKEVLLEFWTNRIFDAMQHEYDHWISVEDELPPYGMQVLVYSEQNIEYEMWFSKRYTAEDAILLGADGTKWCEVITDKNGFCTPRDKLNVTHWRNIEPPRKQDEL